MSFLVFFFQLRRAVVDHVSDSFLETTMPLIMMIEAAQAGNEGEVEECAKLFTDHAAKLGEVRFSQLNLICDVDYTNWTRKSSRPCNCRGAGRSYNLYIHEYIFLCVHIDGSITRVDNILQGQVVNIPGILKFFLFPTEEIGTCFLTQQAYWSFLAHVPASCQPVFESEFRILWYINCSFL